MIISTIKALLYRSAFLYLGTVFKFRWSHAGTPLKYPGKILGIIKSQFGCDLGKIHIRFPEHWIRTLGQRIKKYTLRITA